MSGELFFVGVIVAVIGAALLIYGLLPLICVSACPAPNISVMAGHAYIFNAKTGALISTLTSPNAQTYGFFGWSVAISGKTVVVGAPYETGSGIPEAGNAYIF